MKSLKRLARHALSGRPQTLILAYHRIAGLPLDPQLLSVSPQHFRDQLEVVRRLYRPSRLDETATWLTTKDTSTRRLVITFDDGYRDNLTAAVPLLEANDVPATVFVVAGVVKPGGFFYWDALAHIFLAKRSLPDHLVLSISGKRYAWDVEPRLDTQSTALSSWTVLSDSEPLRRCTAYRQVTALLKIQAPQARAELLEYLVQWAELSLDELHPQYEALSESDLALFARHPLIEIGSHTISHPTMALLGPDEQEREIRGSKKILEDVIGRPVFSFSYPYGAQGDFNRTTLNLVRQAGFNVACANFEAGTGRNTDKYALPRFLVRNWDGDEFERRLADWFERY